MYRKIALMKSKKNRKEKCVLMCASFRSHSTLYANVIHSHTHTQRAPSFSYPSQNLHSPNTDIPHYYAMFIKTVYSTHFVLLLSSPRRVPKWTYILGAIRILDECLFVQKGASTSCRFRILFFFFVFSLSLSLYGHLICKVVLHSISAKFMAYYRSASITNWHQSLYTHIILSFDMHTTIYAKDWASEVVKQPHSSILLGCGKQIQQFVTWNVEHYLISEQD